MYEVERICSFSTKTGCTVKPTLYAQEYDLHFQGGKLVGKKPVPAHEEIKLPENMTNSYDTPIRKLARKIKLQHVVGMGLVAIGAIMYFLAHSGEGMIFALGGIAYIFAKMPEDNK